MGRRRKDPRCDVRRSCSYRRKEFRNGLLADWCQAPILRGTWGLLCDDCPSGRRTGAPAGR